MTDRGSSWIGPAVVAAVINNTGNVRLAFVYPVIMLLVPLALLQLVNFESAEGEAKEYARVHRTAILASRGSLTVALAVGGKDGGATPAETEGVALVGSSGTPGGGVDARALNAAVTPAP